MRRWTMWAASALAAVGAGAGLAVARRREAAPTPPATLPAQAVPGPPEPQPADDPQAALDAARTRLRERADELRRQIEGSGGPAGGG